MAANGRRVVLICQSSAGISSVMNGLVGTLVQDDGDKTDKTVMLSYTIDHMKNY